MMGGRGLVSRSPLWQGRVMKLARAGAAFVVALTVLTSVAACSLSEDAYSDLERPRTADEMTLPSSLPGYALTDFEADTVRWVGTDDGVDVFLARGTPSKACLLAYADKSVWASGCMEPGGSLSLGSSLTLTVRPDGAPAPDDFKSLSTNVFVREDAP